MKFLILLCCLTLPAFGRRLETFIIDGDDASITTYKYTASLRLTGSHACGAALISPSRAVSAAHCVGASISSYSVLAGSADRTVEDCSTCVVRDLTNVTRHPEYVNSDPQGNPNDIAVIYFDYIPPNTDVGYIVMATPSDGDYAGDAGTILGWGFTSNAGPPLSTLLQSAAVTVMSNSDCVDTWSTTQISSGHVCVTSPTVSTCTGDSGSPLVVDNKLVGISSWEVSTCDPAYPSVYTRISVYYDWINETYE